MTWTIPDPDALASRAAGVFEEKFEGADARSENSMLAAISRVNGMSVYDAYLYQARLAQELMVDTSTDWLPRHGTQWGVPQVQATPAQGVVSFAGADTTPVPGGTTLTSAGGIAYTVNTAVTLSGGAVALVTASVAGTAGNLPAGAVLTLASPISGLSPQSATVAAGGLAGGTDIETQDSWKARILQRIRNPPMGGAAADYPTWVGQISPGAIVAVKPNWVGNGTVGLVVAMPGPVVPSAPQLAAIAAYIQTVRPVTGQLVMVPAILRPVDISLHLSPDTVAIRAATLSALALFFSQDAAIGGTIFTTRLDNAISNASGEYSHERALPSADVVAGATEIPVLGTVTFT
jgi:uncharacterized phage protein gp47/JayE